LANEQTDNVFYKRTEKLTDVVFSDDEMQLLNKKLKYNLHYKPKRLLHTLGIEAHTAIDMLPETDCS
jgi:hypothetical protein